MGSKLRNNKLVVWCASRMRGSYAIRNCINNQIAALRSLQGGVFRKLPLNSISLGPPRRYAKTTGEWILSRLSDDAGHRMHKLFPEGKIHRPMPKNTCPKLMRRYERLQNPTIPPAFVAEIRKGRFVGKLFGAVVAPDDSLLFDVSRPQINRGVEKHELFGTLKLPRMRKFPGRVAVLTTPEADLNFSHWLYDLMGRVCWIKRAGYNLKDFTHIILRHTNLPFQIETLNKLEISNEQLIPHTESLHIEAEALIVPSYFNTGFNCDNTSYRCEGLQGIRDFFLSDNSHIEKHVNWPKRIYLSRQGGKARRVLNGNALEDCLREFGFVPVKLETLSLAEQAAMFAQAEAVVGPHGAGFSNVIFCKPGTHILEMFHPDFISTNFWDCSTTLGMNYNAIVTSDQPIHSPFFKFKQEADITIDLTALRNILKSWRL